ncbi:ABC transporter ATP-binding protein [Microbaculum marinum]|uniref:ABC transporter ATP-binding protein n=1 Tax=Microbaculum marinum TaxID=1764581 RepID=A0AAW9RIR8_9HYPH
MATLQISGLTKHFGSVLAVDSFALDVEHGAFVSLLGPSGCGKSTILRMVAGLLEPDAGTIRVAGKDVTWLPPNKRNIGLVFQSYALFPHMSVFENVAFGLRRRKVDEGAIGKRVGEALEMVRLGGLERRLPKELSGGQQQRVALARAIAPQPALLLLDEPLSNLDAKLRDVMRFELRRLQQELSITTVFVTHDQEEALTMSDRICVLSQGTLHQVGSPREIYDNPATPFVAEFFGRSNGFEGTVATAGDVATVALSESVALRTTHLPAGARPGDPVHVTIRQESVNVAAANATDDGIIGTLELVSFAGSTAQFVVRLAGGIELNAETRVGRGGDLPQAGSTVSVDVAPADVIVMART